jgi:class 3 adenylate cyclase
MDVPDVSYARSGDVAIAYQVVGEGDKDLVFVRGTLADLLAGWDMPLFVDHVEGLARSAGCCSSTSGGAVSPIPCARCRRSRRGWTTSAPSWTRPTRNEPCSGLPRRARGSRSCSRPPIQSGRGRSSSTTRPLAASGLPTIRGRRPRRWRRELREIRDRWGDRRYLVERAHRLSPFGAQNEEWLDWFVWYQRRSASPAEAVAFHRMAMEGDVREVLPSVRAPTLVLHRAAARDGAAFVADRISGAKRVEVEGLRAWFSGADPEHNAVLLRQTHEFIDGLASTSAPDHVLATVMFTDIVGSTERAAELGDTAWNELLSRHHTLVRGALVRFRGEELDTAGGGFFAAFDGPGRAIECARAIRESLRLLGLEIRAGLHTGECERVDGKLGGIAIPTGARIAALAEPGEVLVSSTVKDLVAGSGIEFEDRGTHELKGVPGEWRLFAVR